MTNDDKNDPKGFAGLDDLVSDVDAPIPTKMPQPPLIAPRTPSGTPSYSGTRPFPDATEGYRAAEPNLLRNFKALIQRLKWRFSATTKPVQTTSIVLILVIGLIAAIWVHPTAKERQSVQTPLVESTDLRDAKLRDSKEKITASKEPPRTFTFDAATAKPVDAGPREKRLWDFSADGTHLVPHVAPKKKGNLNEPRTIASSTPLEQPREKNGYLPGAKRLFNNGLSSFTVDNTQGSGDAEVRLYTSGIAARSFFVREGTKFTAEKLSPADYTMRYKIVTSGKARVYRARDVFTLSETETETGTRFSRVTVTLYKVRDGNMQADEVPEGQF